MAGDAGTVINHSAFSSFQVKEWEKWMTEACILHAAQVSVPELAVRFGKSKWHISNIMRTDQASEIFKKIQDRALATAEGSLNEKLQAAKHLALDNVITALSDETLRAAKPFDFWNASRQTLETVARVGVPSTVNNTTVNVQQNNMNISAEAIAKMKAAPSMEVHPSLPYNVDYIGPPPPPDRQAEESVYGRGASSLASESENRPSVSLSGRPDAGGSQDK